MSSLSAAQEELTKAGNAKVEEYNKIEQEQENINVEIEKLRAVLLENQNVNSELSLLDDDAEVFKALGPVLVKMELADAKANVKQRLDRYEAEILKMNDRFKEKDKKKKSLIDEINSLQEKVRAQANKTEE